MAGPVHPWGVLNSLWIYGRSPREPKYGSRIFRRLQLIKIILNYLSLIKYASVQLPVRNNRTRNTCNNSDMSLRSHCLDLLGSALHENLAAWRNPDVKTEGWSFYSGRHSHRTSTAIDRSNSNYARARSDQIRFYIA